MSPSEQPNRENVVKCPVEGCDSEKLSRGMHLHVRQSVGNGHGEQGEIPEDVEFDNLEKVGTQEVEVNYPEEREVEMVARLCPYCREPFKGKNGVLIHLGQLAGKKNHPSNGSDVHEAEDFPVAELDEYGNIIGLVTERYPRTESESNERRTDEVAGFEALSKGELEYLYGVVSETDDEKAKRLLRRAFVNFRE